MVNRREFISKGMASLAGFSILPGAGRIWSARANLLPKCPMYQGVFPHGFKHLEAVFSMEPWPPGIGGLIRPVSAGKRKTLSQFDSTPQDQIESIARAFWLR